MREVAAPQEVVDPDLVTHADLAALGVGGADEAIAVEVLARAHDDVVTEGPGAELLRAFLPEIEPIPEPQQARHPPCTGLGHPEAQPGEALERARPEQEPHRARRPP